MKKETPKIIVGLSGGIDSTVAAAILSSHGFLIHGVFLRLTGNKSEKESLISARKIAKILKIKFSVLDKREEFKNKIVAYFLREYRLGRTPNPCIKCNPEIKFRYLLEEMKRLGFNKIATGHYARIQIGGSTSTMEVEPPVKLFQAKDETKDQSYFLYRLQQKQLRHMLFPLGELKKSEVRVLAEKLNLPNAQKSESQDICFMQNNNLEEFLQKNISLRKGPITDVENNVLGEHKGLPLYTIGQRKGINIGGTGPYYVSGKDLKRNILKVANLNDERNLFSDAIKVKKVSWVSGQPDFPAKVLVKTRYHQISVYAIIKPYNKGKALEYMIEFLKPQKAVAPGQSAVFYGKDGEVIGGGIIS